MHGEMQWYRYSTTVLRYGGMHGEMQGKYYRYCSRSIRYSTDLNSENNKFDMETFDLVSEYCMENSLRNDPDRGEPHSHNQCAHVEWT